MEQKTTTHKATTVKTHQFFKCTVVRSALHTICYEVLTAITLLAILMGWGAASNSII